jgi:HD-like signal output (HDOD) protein/CheY-like chemotaxis protein
MKRILFVDDESNILESLRRMLHADRCRWEMIFVVGAEAALHAFEEHGGFDVIVTDMLMPGMNGAELLRIVRDRFPDTARLILSGYAETAYATQVISVAHQLLNKPCDKTELRTAIERVCTLQDILSTPELRAIIGSISTLPSLSKSYNALARAVQMPLVSIEEVARIIGQDIAMSAKILHLVNSAFFGLPRKVTQIQAAINYLGMDTIRNLALTSEAFTVFKPDTAFQRSMLESLQERAHRAAAIINVFGLDPGERDIAIVAALLRDIGYFIVAWKMPERFSAIMEMVEREGCTSLRAEESILGITHAEIGAYLLGLWGIDSQVVEAVAHHHRPTRIPHSKLDASVAVYLAGLLLEQIETHPEDENGTELCESDRSSLCLLELLEQYPRLREEAQRVFYVTTIETIRR